MADENSRADSLGLLLGNYIKRWMDGNLYDSLFTTEFGKQLQKLHPTTKYGIEFGLNLLTTFFDRRLADDTPLRRMVKEVGLDAAPEISRRLINGAKATEEKALVAGLLMLDQTQLISLLGWLYDMDPERRHKMLTQLQSMSGSGVARLSEMPPADRDRFMDLFAPPPKPSTNPEHVRALDEVTLKLRQLRGRLRAKRLQGQNDE